MKKILSIFLSVFFVCLLCVNTFAFEYKEGELFTVDIPDEFTQSEKGMFISSDNSTFSVTYEDNTELGYSVKDLSEAKLRKMAEDMASQAKEVFASLGKNAEMELVSLEKTEHPNGMNAVVSVYKTTAVTDEETVIRYQKVYEFGGEKNKYTFTYTPSDDSKINDMDGSFSSIVINENELSNMADNLASAVALLVVISLVVIGIAKFLRKPTSKRK